MLVVASHTRAPFVPRAAGQVGVTLFFALSGFLIATLLCQELEASGRVSFRRFYERRARRLFPALIAVVVVSVLLTGTTGIGFVTPAEVVGALTYSTNVIALFVPIQDKGMLYHTWSLVIEEQFYLVWPVLVVRFWRWRLLLLAAAVTAAFAIAFHRVTMLGGRTVTVAWYSVSTLALTESCLAARSPSSYAVDRLKSAVSPPRPGSL